MVRLGLDALLLKTRGDFIRGLSETDLATDYSSFN